MNSTQITRIAVYDATSHPMFTTEAPVSHEHRADLPVPVSAVPQHLRPGSGPSADRARLAQRLERAAFLVDCWQRDRSTFDLFAGDFVWDDKELALALPREIGWEAVKLASKAAVKAYQKKHKGMWL